MVYVAGDHYAVELVAKIEKFLEERKIEFKNIGTKNSDQKLPLEQMIPLLTRSVLENETNSGILVCGTGAGVEIGANRYAGIRASLCVLPKQAEYARVYDNANVLCLSSWLTEDPGPILEAWLANSFDGNEDRKKMIQEFDSWH